MRWDVSCARTWAPMAEGALRWHTTTARAKDAVLEALLGVAALVDGAVELCGRWALRGGTHER